MKILCAEYNPAGEAVIVPLGDDALLRNNDDFYIPPFTENLSCTPQFVVRLCKLGKSVHERFAARYFEEVGVGIRFYADDYERELAAKALPLVAASSFDGSAAISALSVPESGGTLEYAFFLNDNEVYRQNRGQMVLGIEKLIALASDFHTLKIGDFLYCGSPFRLRGVKAGDRLRICLGDKTVMNFEIK